MRYESRPEPSRALSNFTSSHFARIRNLPLILVVSLIYAVSLGGLLIGAGPVLAAQLSATLGQGNCMGDRYFQQTGGKLVCTANDIAIASASNIRDLGGEPLSTCISGSTFSFIADFTVQLNAQTRYDIGLYFATEGDPNLDGAISGTCDANIITPSESPDFVNLDSDGDICGDIDAAHNPQIVTVEVDNVLCQASPDSSDLLLPNCTSWRQPGSNTVCTGGLDAYPGSPSKCNCDNGFTVPITVETGSLKVTKTVADPATATRSEPGGDFTFTVTAENTSSYTDVTLDSICDDTLGTIAQATGAENCPAGVMPEGTTGILVSTDCSLSPAVILTPGSGYSCSFTATVNSQVNPYGGTTAVTDTVALNAHDQSNHPLQGHDSATVYIKDVPPTAQVIKSLDSLQCALVRYQAKVNNLHTASVQLSGLSDSGFGDVTTLHGSVVGTTCGVPEESQGLGTLQALTGAGALPATIPADGSYTCLFDANFCGSSHIDTLTGILVDDDGVTKLSFDSNSVKVNVTATQQ